ncbi:hypothetical protein T492DRAFT_1120114 [Pavlovales sp. CCMP2436]|nr:hypothetical protein T492DRAFT_1120114 [Pavlovales sp. CCMP2436]
MCLLRLRWLLLTRLPLRLRLQRRRLLRRRRRRVVRHRGARRGRDGGSGGPRTRLGLLLPPAHLLRQLFRAQLRLLWLKRLARRLCRRGGRSRRLCRSRGRASADEPLHRCAHRVKVVVGRAGPRARERDEQCDQNPGPANPDHHAGRPARERVALALPKKRAAMAMSQSGLALRRAFALAPRLLPRRALSGASGIGGATDGLHPATPAASSADKGAADSDAKPVNIFSAATARTAQRRADEPPPRPPPLPRSAAVKSAAARPSSGAPSEGRDPQRPKRPPSDPKSRKPPSRDPQRTRSEVGRGATAGLVLAAPAPSSAGEDAADAEVQTSLDIFSAASDRTAIKVQTESDSKPRELREPQPRSSQPRDILPHKPRGEQRERPERGERGEGSSYAQRDRPAERGERVERGGGGGYAQRDPPTERGERPAYEEREKPQERNFFPTNPLVSGAEALVRSLMPRMVRSTGNSDAVASSAAAHELAAALDEEDDDAEMRAGGRMGAASLDDMLDELAAANAPADGGGRRDGGRDGGRGDDRGRPERYNRLGSDELPRVVRALDALARATADISGAERPEGVAQGALWPPLDASLLPDGNELATAALVRSLPVPEVTGPRGGPRVSVVAAIMSGTLLRTAAMAELAGPVVLVAQDVDLPRLLAKLSTDSLLADNTLSLALLDYVSMQSAPSPPPASYADGSTHGSEVSTLVAALRRMERRQVVGSSSNFSYLPTQAAALADTLADAELAAGALVDTLADEGW